MAAMWTKDDQEHEWDGDLGRPRDGPSGQRRPSVHVLLVGVLPPTELDTSDWISSGLAGHRLGLGSWLSVWLAGWHRNSGRGPTPAPTPTPAAPGSSSQLPPARRRHQLHGRVRGESPSLTQRAPLQCRRLVMLWIPGEATDEETWARPKMHAPRTKATLPLA